MSTVSEPAGVGSLGVTHPELMTSFRRAQWRMLLAAMFCYLFFYTGRQTFGFAIPGIQAEFGVSKAALGWASAALLWCYAIGQAVNGGDKFGGRRVMSAGAILSFIMNWATSLSTGVISLSVFWGINGYFQSMGWAPGSRLLSNWWGRHERGTVYGLYTFAAGLASVLSFVTSLIVVGHFHLDWRWIFRIPVTLLLVGGVAFYLIAREKPENMGFDSPHDDAVDDTAKEAAAVIDSESSFSRYKAVLSNWRLLVASVAIGFQNAARYGLLVWVPVHFLGADWSKADASSAAIDPRWISIALPVGMAVGAFSNGWVSDHIFNSRRYAAIVLYMALACVTALYMSTIPTTAVYQGMVVLFLCGFFVYGPQSSFWALCPDLVGHKRAGTATGVMNFCAYLFAGLGEPMIGHFMDSTQQTSIVFVIVSVCSAASAAVAMFIRR